MSTIAAALEHDAVVWKQGEGSRLDLVADGDILGHIDGDEVVLEGRRMVLQQTRGQWTLVDTTRGAKVAALRMVGQGTGRVGAVTLARHRVRVSKMSVNPFQWHATDGAGGPQLLTARKFRGQLKIKAGEQFDVSMDAGVTSLAMALTAMPELGAAAAGSHAA